LGKSGGGGRKKKRGTAKKGKGDPYKVREREKNKTGALSNNRRWGGGKRGKEGTIGLWGKE